MKRKNFLHYPEYPGGKDELKRYISDNLIYPEEALREKISGTVWLSAVINDNGLVSEVVVEKGL
ncbi:MAG TPA: energy transducer TonB, partial [Prolixibacteraceae bacterium]|nr:energy transducer TonB [Prolixibacteraceae bacterium]